MKRNNIKKVHRLIYCILIALSVLSDECWCQNDQQSELPEIKSVYPHYYGQSVENLYIKLNTEKKVTFQQSGIGQTIDGYISWYLKKADGTVSIAEIKDNNNLTVVKNRKYWSRSNNDTPPSGACTIDLKVTSFPQEPDTLILEASTFNKLSTGSDGITESPLITIQKKYVIKNAESRAEDLYNRNYFLKSSYINGWKNAFLDLINDQNKVNYFLDVYEIHTPLKSLSSTVYGTNYRLSENLANYYVSSGKNIYQANKVRWTVFAKDGTLMNSYIPTPASNIWDHTFGSNDGVYINSQETQLVYVVAEVSYNGDGNSDNNWYPVSFLTIYLEPNIEVAREEILNEKPEYKYRTKKFLEENGYIMINEVNFNDVTDNNGNEIIPIENVTASNNYSLDLMPNANTVYAFAYPARFKERKNTRLTAGRNEYALYRTLNYKNSNNVSISKGTVSINDETGIYNDWFSGNGYDKYILDRTYDTSGGEELGFFLYLDASDMPGVITKIKLDGTLCPSTSLVFTAWVCDMASTSSSTHADIGFTLKGVDESGDETILTKYYSGKINRDPDNNTKYGKTNWQQVYFSFTFDEDELGYDHYILEVSNNCPNSDGADYAIDDIEIWRSTPNIEVSRQNACYGQSTLLVSSDYQTILRNMGWKAGEDVWVNSDEYKDNLNIRKYRYGLMGENSEFEHNSKVGNVYFAFLDENKNEWITITVLDKSEYAAKSMRIPVSTDLDGNISIYAENQDEALLYEQVINLRAVSDYNNDIDKWKEKFQNQNHEEIDISGVGTPGEENFDISKYNEVIETLYGRLDMPRLRCPWYNPDEGKLYLSVIDVDNTDLKYKGQTIENDDGTETTASGVYWVMSFSASDVINAGTDAVNPNSDCALTSKFVIEPSEEILIEAGLDEDVQTKACIGSLRRITAKLQWRNEEGNIVDFNDEGVKYLFDWYLYDLDTYNSDTESHNDISIKELLEVYRDDMKDYNYITIEEAKSWTGGRLGKEASERLQTLLSENQILTGSEGGKTIDLELTNQKEIVVMAYIYTSEGDLYTFCSMPEEISLPESGNDSPNFYAGFPGVLYPFESSAPLRLGINNLENEAMLEIPVRNDILEMDPEAEYLGVLDATDISVRDENSSSLIPLGEVKYLYIPNGYDNNSGETAYIKIKWNGEALNLLKEGQSYELLFPYVQYAPDESNPGKYKVLDSACDGLASLTIKVVPEFLTWKGNESDKWYNDSKWNQSTKNDVYFDGYEDYPDRDANGMDDVDDAFAPLYFTKITIPERKELNLGNPEDNVKWGYIKYDMAVNNTGVNESIEVVPYYINKVEQIYFKPKATLINQHYLNYEKAWVEFEMKKNTKYWLASPLKDVFSGDMYAPKGSGRQTTPAFEEINYIHGNQYNRWDPAFYQKAWDKGVTYYTDKNGTTYNKVSAVMSNWSIEYNDVNVPYTLGKGFYARVEGNFTGDKNNGIALVRLPKADKSYSYYTKAADVSSIKERTDAGKMADGEEIIITLSDDDDAEVNNNPDGDGNHFLIGNPYMAYLNMEAFFTGNPGLAEKYWTLDNGNVIVGTPDVDWEWEENKQLGYIAPMQAFFVERAGYSTTETQADEGVANTDLTVTFSIDMTVANPTSKEGETTTRAFKATNPQLTILAKGTEGKSVSFVVQSDFAENVYKSDEDAVALLDSELKIPMVYTVAGNCAAAVNKVKDMQNIPLGVYAEEDEEVEVTIEGMSQFVDSLYLHDALTGKSVLLDGDTYTLRVNGENHGRYTITTKGGITVESNICVYSPSSNNLMIAASPSETLEQVRVFDMSGRMVENRADLGSSNCRLRIASGIYIVYAKTEAGETKVKVRVK